MAKRLTKKGIAIRKGRQQAQVDRFVAQLNIGSKDKRAIRELLSQNLTTKRGVSRSKRLIDLIGTGNYKSIQRFGEFSGLKEIGKTPTLKTLTRLLEDDAAFYVKEQELINDYNSLTDTEKENKRNQVVQNLERKFNEYRAAQERKQ